MHPIARSIRYGFTATEYDKYLKFINGWPGVQQRVYMDPFAVNVPPDILDAAYVERPAVEEQIYKAGNRVIVGVKGSGKTALWQRSRPITKDLSGRDVVFLRMSPEIVTSDCLARHHWDKKKTKILIDDTECLSEQSLVHLIDTTQQWHDKTSGRLNFIVFANRERKAFIQGWDYVKQENLEVYDLPAWEESELRALLGQRLAAWSIGFIDYQGFKEPRKSPGITNSPKFHNLLGNFDQFNSNEDLQAVFVDNRIALWRSKLPQADTKASRISQTIAYLLGCENKKGENGLILFLNVLYDLTDPEDRRAQQLGEVIKDLESEWRPPSSATEVTASDYTLNWAKEMPNLADDDTRRDFISTIIKGVVAVGVDQGEWDTPIHALNLARGFIAACAGCWPQYRPPLSIAHLNALVSIYWGKGGEE